MDLIGRADEGLKGAKRDVSGKGPYVVGSVVGPVVTQISQDEAQVLLSAVQRLVVVAVVALLVAQGEVGRQRRQLGSNVGRRGVQVTSAPQGGTLTGPQELWQTKRDNCWNA